MSIYTRRGDDGTTGQLKGPRISKSKLGYLGTIDELNSFIGLALAFSDYTNLNRQLFEIQNDLYKLMSGDELNPAKLERWIDDYDLSPLKHFINRGGSKVSAFLHVCCTVCRRAERYQPSPYLNRLSDYFFTAARAYVRHSS